MTCQREKELLERIDQSEQMYQVSALQLIKAGKRIAELEALNSALCRDSTDMVCRAAAIDAERGKSALGYDAVFNAIAKSTNTFGGNISIGVNAFEEAIGGKIFLHPQPPQEMTPEMMLAVQMNSELGAYVAANMAGAYDLFSEFWKVAVAAAAKDQWK